jgi:hypothetical protein
VAHCANETTGNPVPFLPFFPFFPSNSTPFLQGLAGAFSLVVCPPFIPTVGTPRNTKTFVKVFLDKP